MFERLKAAALASALVLAVVLCCYSPHFLQVDNGAVFFSVRSNGRRVVHAYSFTERRFLDVSGCDFGE